MRKALASVETPDEEFQEWPDDIVCGPLVEGLARIGALLKYDPKRSESELNALITDAPFMARIPASIIGVHNFTSAVSGSIEKTCRGA